MSPKKHIFSFSSGIKNIALILLCLLGNELYAQLDTKHYIPPMFARENLGEHYLVLGTPVTNTFNVTVQDGAGNVLNTIPISSGSSSTTQIGTELNSPFLVSEAQLNSPISVGKGLILTAPEPFYASVRVKASSQATSLTSKGEKAALGIDFRCASMFSNPGYSEGKSNTISIMATEDNTTVTISDINTGFIFRATSTAGTPLTSSDIIVTLNAGESYVVSSFMDEPNASNNINGLNGTHVTSDKNIVVNCGTWLGGNAIDGTSPNGSIAFGRDIGIDQIVSKDEIGDEYVLIKGFGVDNERVMIVASEDNTDIFLNGSGTPTASLNAGDVHILDGTSFSGNNNLYISASSPIYVTQMLNGGDGYTDDNERQAGMNFLPPAKCTGAKQVDIPNVNFIGEAYISIVADAGANVYVNGSALGAGNSVPGTSDYVTYQVSGYTGDVAVTSDKRVRVSLVNLNGNVGAAGYFSGFSKDFNLSATYVNNSEPSVDEIAEGCGEATITIERSSLSANTSETIDLHVQGSATEGIDYTDIPNQLTFAVGQTSISFVVEAFEDLVTEGDENVIIEIALQGDVCGTDEIEFIIKDVEELNVILDDSNVLCPGDDVTLEAVVSGGAEPYEYWWNNGNTSNSITVTPNATSTYTIYVTDVCKEDTVTASAIVEVPIYDLTIFSSPDTSVLCPYTEMLIAAEGTGGLPAYDYQWYENGIYIYNGPMMIISPPQTSDYVVLVTDQCGLQTYDTVSIHVQTPLMVPTVPENILACPYDSTEIWVDIDGGLPPFTYEWSHSGETTSNVFVNPGWTTTYSVTVQDQCMTYEVYGTPIVEVVRPQAAFDILSNTVMENLPISFQNNTTGGNFWEWDLGNGDNSTDFSPTTIYEEDGIYQVTLIATNNIGCKDTAIKEIRIKPEFYFYAPNAFTPNSDAFNNFYSVSVIGATDFEFSIFDRWGELILQTSDQYFQWDGSYKNEPSPDGVYIYKAVVTGEDGERREFSGHISLLR